MSQDGIIRLRDKTLKGIFDFYARQQLQNQKGGTFDDINKDYHTLNLVKLVRFCIDFQIPVPKLEVTHIFKRVSPNVRDLTYEQFKEMIEKLFIEVNRQRGHELKKRLKQAGKSSAGGDDVDEMKRQMQELKVKTREEIVEEAYQYLELDDHHRVDAKKKGIQMSFLNDGHPIFKATGVDISQMPATKAKLRNFTDEQKVEIRERVKQIKLERDVFMASNPGHRFVSHQRKLLKSGGSNSQISRPNMQNSNSNL